MRSSSTQHLECIRERGGGVLNVRHLLQLLQDNDGDASDIVEVEVRLGKKRSAPTASQGRRKRRKTTAGVAVKDTDDIVDDNSTVPVYHHSFEIRYTNNVSDLELNTEDDATAEEFGWLEEETLLKAWLRDRAGSLGEVDLGKVNLLEDNARLVVFSDKWQSPHALLTVPPVDAEFKTEDHDMKSRLVCDPLVAFSVLQGAGRAKMQTRLRLSTCAPVEGDEDEFPFRLILDINVSLITPAIFEPTLHAARSKRSNSHIDEAQRRALSFVFISDVASVFDGAKVDISLLYPALHPAPGLESVELEKTYQPTDLRPMLLPFQRRSVAWMLSREDMHILSNGSVANTSAAPRDELPLFWQAVDSAIEGGSWYYNRVTGQLSAERPEDKDSHRLGGILAEEPGLGKTLECISLILLNPAVHREPTIKTWNIESRIFVKQIKTTLIVTPQSLAQQWADELALHAPTLKVLVYDGWSKVAVPISEKDLAIARHQKARLAEKAKARAARSSKAKSDGAGDSRSKRVRTAKAEQDDPDSEVDENDDLEEDGLMDWCQHVNSFDVCITTYNVLQQDLGVARPPPDRPRRTIATYINIERSRSPLVMCEWHRVIMDEVQMAGGGKTEEMVSLIPRVSSFAVSGTPARSQVADLIHVLNFLRIDSVVNSPRVWTRLLKPGYAREFVSLFQKYAIRTMKAAVQDELTIPKQTRFLVPIQLGKVERHVYDKDLENALLDLGFDARGVTVSENWELDTAALRSWLRKLRGICTHPQVGHLQNQADKSNKSGGLKTMAEDMKEQNWRNFMDDRKLKVQALTVLAQLTQRMERNAARYKAALETLLQAEKEVVQVISDIEAIVAKHEAEGRLLKQEATALIGADVNNQKGKVRASDAFSSVDHESFDGDDDGLPRNSVGDRYRTKRNALQLRLRECQVTLHKVQFLKGDIYHILGESFGEQESAAYAAAEDLRRILLKTTEHAARRAMAQLHNDADASITEEELYIEVPFVDEGGKRSQDLIDEANEMIEELLNEQSGLLWKWRTRIIALLTQPLTSGESDADGQEYTRSLDTQGEAEAYLQAYAALLADKREAMTSERTLLATLDVKEKKTRKTKAARKAEEAALYHEDEVMAVLDVDAQPEHQVLHKELQEERKAILEEFDSSRAVRSVMVDLSNVAARIVRKEDQEKIKAQDAAKKLRELIAQQGQLMDKLQADLSRFRKAFNERISYFRQLQEISDTVSDAQWEGTMDKAMADTNLQIANLDVKINTGRARQRFLEHLAKSQEAGTMDEDEEGCILCKCEFTRGYITQCGHVFCEGCMKAWLQRHDGRACPVCRVGINPRELQRFVVESKEEQSALQPVRSIRPISKESAPKSRRQIEYNVIDPDVFESIQTMESHGSYGSKIQTLIRHLLYVQVIDPGAQSIVFSAWADSLKIIDHALKSNGITCLRIDQAKGKQNAAKRFRTNPGIQVLLLHGERENAGLNVTCASRVFLVESVVHHAFEIQAIARIDRMGQSRPTEEDTVERNILDLAARQGLSLYTKENSAGTLTSGPITAPTKRAVDAPAKKAQKGDFVYKTDDMLAIFFPHLFEDIAYLLPQEEPVASIDQVARDSSQEPQVRRSARFVNAEAGPSRLN
ncbi:hypothetical protein EW026_g5964 [Hermanssonia centrifuga]|uniref:RING-type domain-containing protein n=1 Tax=Hermanssonia centrifuga TaxID=98765 RepID=A0A4S4KDG8_9APHY|nr:hypothetical protein EW026_g5964 [Hermanssonia centrifuga]